MRIGLIVRAEERGLGIQTYEAWRHLSPAKTLLVDVGTERAFGFDGRPERYPDATVFHAPDLRFDEKRTRDWLEGLDVVWSAETFYDWRMCDWARDMGVRTVCHANPELWPHYRYPFPEPDAWWVATPWRLEHLPPRTRVVPHPVALDRFETGDHLGPYDTWDGPLRVLHVVGRAAIGDRNGTATLLEAVRNLRRPMDITVASQRPDELGNLPAGNRRHRVFLRTMGPTREYPQLYEQQDVLVLPRRYGGLCLPVQEALGAGLAVVMSDCSPNEIWPGERVLAKPGITIEMLGGVIDTWNTDPVGLANVLNELSSNREALKAARQASWDWALLHSWEALRDTWLDEFDRVVFA